MFGLQLPLTCNPWTTLSNLTNKVREKYFVEEVFLHASLSFLRRFFLRPYLVRQWRYNSTYLWRVFNFQIFFSLFYGWVTFPGAGWPQRSYCDTGFVQTKILLQVSLTCAFLARRACSPIIQLSSSISSPINAAWLTLNSFVQQTKGNRVQIAYPFSPLSV